MDTQTEVTRVTALLLERHPRFPEPTVRALVERAFKGLSQASIKTFVPGLAYRQAHAELHYADTGSHLQSDESDAALAALIFEEAT